MNDWTTWLTLIGGVVAIVGQWLTGYWLSAIGGLLAVIGAFGMMSK